MSGLLVNAAVDYVRGQFTTAQVKTVQAYGGEFNALEQGQVSFEAPAIFVAMLGWKPETDSRYLTGRNVRGVRMAAYVVTKHAKRDVRMALAATLAEMLAVKLRAWRPQDIASDLLDMAPLEEEPACENLYGRLIDSKGMALWMLDWTQCARPKVALQQIYDLLAIEITDHTHQGAVPAPAPPTGSLTVTEDVQFEPLAPAA